jgi:hypothetical protein
VTPVEPLEDREWAVIGGYKKISVYASGVTLK